MTIAAILLAIALVVLAIRRPLTTVIICAVIAGAGTALSENAVNIPLIYAPAVMLGMIVAAVTMHLRQRRAAKSNDDENNT